MRASRPCWRQRAGNGTCERLFLRLPAERAAVARGPRRAPPTRAPRAQGAFAAAQQQRAAQAAEFPAAAGRALRGCAEPEWLADARARPRRPARRPPTRPTAARCCRLCWSRRCASASRARRRPSRFLYRFKGWDGGAGAALPRAGRARSPSWLSCGAIACRATGESLCMRPTPLCALVTMALRPLCVHAPQATARLIYIC